MEIAGIVFWFALALIFAFLEIEIEGKYGWSEKTQTWYRLNKLLGKPLTGYHIMVFGTAILISHLPFVFGLPWNIKNEMWIMAIHFSWTPLWDYLWMVFNPHYGVTEFKQNKVWWYQNSVWVLDVMPLEQLAQWGIALVLAWFANQFSQISSLLLGFIVLTTLSTFTLVPVYRKWYWKMRESDDRSKVNIFH